VLYLGGELGLIDVNSGLYDYFLPGGGLLVWHVNRDRIESGLADNSINRYGDGLRLLEADGIQDIGVVEAYVRGWFGSARDPFGGYDAEGNTNDYTELFPEGIPASRAYDRSWTGFGLSNVRTLTSDVRSLMRFKARIEPFAGAFPFTVASVDSAEAAQHGGTEGARGVEPASLVALPIALAGAEPALGFVGRAPGDSSAGWEPVLFALGADGRPRFTPVADMPPGGIVRLAGPLVGAPVLLPDGGGTVVFGTRTGEVHGLPAAIGSTAPSWAWTTKVAEALAWGPTPGGSWLLLPVAPQQLRLIDAAGELVGEDLALVEPGGATPERLAGPPCPAPTASGPGWLVPTENGWFRVTVDRSGFETDPAFHAYPEGPADAAVVRSACLRAADGDVVVLFTAPGRAATWKLTPTGTLGPFAWRGVPDEPLVAEPAVADLDGNGRDDVVMLTASRIHACQADGAPLSGFPVQLGALFPLPDSTRVAGPAVVCDTDGDRANEIYFATTGGHLVGLEADGRLVARTPFLWGDRGASGLAVGEWTTDDGRRLLMLVSEGGYAGPPLGRQLYCGRVLGYRLPGGRSESGGTSEWCAVAGGFARGGPVGAAADLGAAAPLAAFADDPIVYPNPLRGRELWVRYYSSAGMASEITVYNLEGEAVARTELFPVAGQINEQRVELPGLASGLYLCRLVHDARGGRETTVITLAVER
jgi:hypothetical protein